jgi:hypothetical protein
MGVIYQLSVAAKISEVPIFCTKIRVTVTLSKKNFKEAVSLIKIINKLGSVGSLSNLQKGHILIFWPDLRATSCMQLSVTDPEDRKF